MPSATESFFENINKAAQAVEKSLTSSNAPIQSTPIKNSAGIILFLTEDQFHFLYPDYFIADLTNFQTVLIQEFDPDYKPISKIETDTQVRFVEEKIVAAFLSAGIITKEQAENFVTTIRFTLPELQLIDLKKYGPNSFYKSPQFSKLERKAAKNLFIIGLMEQLKDMIARKARAICGACTTLPLCFQEGASTPGVAGSELFFPSCYCTGCLTELGCLSANSGIAAIYDPMTGICGIGI
mgnify:FL=1